MGAKDLGGTHRRCVTAPAPATNAQLPPSGGRCALRDLEEPEPLRAVDGSCPRRAADGPEWDRPPIGYPITNVQVVALITQPMGAADPCAT